MTQTTQTHVDPPPHARIVFVTDQGMLRPTLFALWTVLQHFKGQADIHVWGDGLTAADWQAVAQVCKGYPDITLHPLDLSPEDMAGAGAVGDYISAATMGRLIIPRKLSGRVLYLDGDVRVTADLSPLFAIDMQGHPVAAVRDYVVSSQLAKGVAPGHRNEARLTELTRSMGQAAVSSYFNSGVLLMNVDAISAAPALSQAMQDLERASMCTWGDQDHLNIVFSGRVCLLDPAYNASWTRTAKQRAFIEKLGPAPGELAPIPDAIIHFHGSRKPWKKARRDLWSRRARAVFAYRRAQARFVRAYPDLDF